jgi:hypothetical protein
MPSDYHQDVRTTLTLDRDVHAKLRQEMRKTGESFKEAVNRFLRLGLNGASQAQPLEPFVVRGAQPLGLPPGLS